MRKIYVFILLALFFSFDAYANEAIKLLEENIEARGGLDKLNSIKVLECLVITNSQQMPVPDTSRNLYAGEKYRITSLGTNSIVFDNGKDGYFLSAMFGADTLTKMNSSQRATLKDQFKQIKGFLLGFIYNTFLKKNEFKIEYLGKESIGKAKVKKIKISSALSSVETNIYIGNIDKLTKKIEILAPNNQMEFIFSAYQEIDGILFPRNIIMKNSQMELHQVIENLRINHNVADSVFEEF